MCGINGIANFSKPPRDSERVIARMNDALAHRGPDGEGVYASPAGAVVLGSRRLSIVDVEGGAMPMVATHGGHEYAIVSNGEFFNYKDVRKELEKKYAFTTRSDTEVALYSYIEWGEECVNHLYGQFAFLVYDGRKERVFLARDRVGIKPLYYGIFGGTLVASSEPKGVLAHPDVKAVPDPRAIAEYFLGIMALGKSESIDRSFFEGIRALPPATWASFDARGITMSRYYEVPLIHPPRPRAELKETLRESVTRAVLSQVPEEVPYGILVSGGLDSSIIAALTVSCAHPPRTAVSIGYEGEENADFNNARLLAEQKGFVLEAPLLKGTRTLADIDTLVRALDRPYDSFRELALFEMYKILHDKGSKVAFTGEGADEFNLGYYYTLPGFRDADEHFATAEQFRESLRVRAEDTAKFFRPSFVSPATIGEVIEEHARELYERAPAETPLAKMEYFYIKKFLKGRLDIHDRFGMAHSVEARVPFCDEMVLEASLEAPPEYNLRDGTEKALLREAFSDLLPEEIASRRKSAMPESKNVQVYKAVLAAYDAAEAEADPSVWSLLNRAHAAALRERAAKHVQDIELGNARPLSTPLGVTGPAEFRMSHLFLLLTFLRWHRLYFLTENRIAT